SLGLRRRRRRAARRAARARPRSAPAGGSDRRCRRGPRRRRSRRGEWRAPTSGSGPGDLGLAGARVVEAAPPLAAPAVVARRAAGALDLEAVVELLLVAAPGAVAEANLPARLRQEDLELPVAARLVAEDLPRALPDGALGEPAERLLLQHAE